MPTLRHGARALVTTLLILAPIAAAQQPNIIYAFSDQHRWHSMGHTTMPDLKTPNMDRMAAEGVAFDLCVSNYPVCSPYRGILMTGQWPYQNGVTDNKIPLDPDTLTIGDAFKDAGYLTGYVGKWHLGGVDAEPYGFDYSVIWTGTNAHYDKSKFHTGTGEPKQPEGYNATLMTDQAESFIRLSAGAPFFLMVSWNPPHSNYLDAPEDMRELYPEGALPYRENYIDPTGDDTARSRRLWPNNADAQYRGYHAHVSAIDRELGRLMETVQDLGLAENTIIVYSSDHGALLGSHDYGGKRQPYDESIRVPYLFWGGPIGFPGRRIASPVGTIDVMPTLLGLIGADIPEHCHGRNLAPALLSGDPVQDQTQLLMHIAKDNATFGNDHPAPIFRGLRTKRYTYALFPDGEQWLFDNLDDPYQQNNIANEPAAAPLQRELRRELGTLLEQAEDPFLRKRPR